MGSIFENEGQRLYEIVRELKPKLIVEIGGFYGCSTSWLAKGVKDNKKGKVISIDIAAKWNLIPEGLKKYIEFVNDDAFLIEIPKNIDIVFEDGLHTPGFTRDIARLYKPRQAFIVHDYRHNSQYGHNVKRDFLEVFGKPDEIFHEPPSDCGLAMKYFAK